ncbi:MAG: response regulator [Pirellulales bacterium]|nr:response regulator [Pirellulales bacterium]
MTKVLVVDDAPVDRRLAGGILEKHGQLTISYAANGREALASIEAELPDAVVTDLQMPEMNGLELTETVRRRFPLLPVILMTAHGSEDIAVQALERGAASYVPKSNLARDLLDTVENVLAMARADRRHDRLMECVAQAETVFVLDNDAALIPPLVDYLQEHVMRMRLCDETGRIRVGVALEEALLNALYHGNLELSTEELRDASSGLLQPEGDDLVAARRQTAPYKDRRLHVTAKISHERAEYTIRDEGPGFAASTIPDPSDPVSLERESGRGLILMRTFMDEVRFNHKGNEVTLVKEREN